LKHVFYIQYDQDRKYVVKEVGYWDAWRLISSSYWADSSPPKNRTLVLPWVADFNRIGSSSHWTVYPVSIRTKCNVSLQGVRVIDEYTGSIDTIWDSYLQTPCHVSNK
jgi:hypothetical protein